MTSPNPSILVVEDDPQIRRFLKLGLKSHGYKCHECPSGEEGLGELKSLRPELVILDLGLPDMDGLDFIGKARTWTRVPILVLTVRDREQDKIRLLDQGADDYLTKPFAMGELLARIRVALRHSQIQSRREEPIFENGALQIDFASRRVLVGSREVHLTPTEYKLLTLLAKNAGRVLTQQFLLREIWGPNAIEQGHYLRVHMHQLRHKIEATPAQPRWLINDPGVGYRLKLE